MLLPTFPTANVFLSGVCPLKSALAVLLSVFELALVPFPIRPCLYASALNHAQSELALVIFVQLCEVVPTETLKQTVHEITFVVGTVLPCEPALAVLLPFVEGSEVLGRGSRGIAPCFLALPVLVIILPISFVLSVGCVYKHSVPVGLIIHPLPFINIAISMRHSAPAVRFVSSPHAFVFRTVWPKLDAHTVSFTCMFVPLSFVKFPVSHFLILINVHPLLILPIIIPFLFA